MNQDNDTSADPAVTGTAPEAAAAPPATDASASGAAATAAAGDVAPPAAADTAAPAASVATQEPRPASIAGPKAKPLQPRMKATGQRRSKERGAHTNSKKNPGKRAKKGGS